MNNLKKKPTAYLICGYIGAGKTRFAKKLEKEISAIRITKDEWLIRLFGNDPGIPNFERYDEVITELSMEIAIDCLKAGADVIIDDGFWVKEQRYEMYNRIKKVGAEYKLYYLECSDETMRQRIKERSKHPTKDSFIVTEELYESYMKYWEPPGENEEYILIKN